MQAVQTNGFGERELLEPTMLPHPIESEPESEPEPDYPLVMVEWHDAWFDFDQADPEDCSPDYVVRTVGFLVAEGPRFLSVAQEVLPNGDGFRAVTHIPLAIVERVAKLAAEDD